jgi:hypothetical protein
MTAAMFCTLCGSKLIERERKSEKFDAMTGRPYFRKEKICPKKLCFWSEFLTEHDGYYGNWELKDGEESIWQETPQ